MVQSRNEHLVGIKRKDGTPFKLLSDPVLKRMLFDWLKGKDIGDICIKYKITRTQFHRQKYYKDRILKEVFKQVKILRHLEYNSMEISQILDLPIEQINIIISKILCQYYKK